MAESTTPVDLLNPGQVFACLGLIEAADVLLGNARGTFDWSREEVKFRVVADGADQPVERVLRFLDEAEAVVRAPAGFAKYDEWRQTQEKKLKGKRTTVWRETWGAEPVRDPVGAPFPFPEPDKPATLPALLRDEEGNEIPIEYWGDATRRDNVKFWAGSGGYPGVALLRDARSLAGGRMRQYTNNPFALSAAQTSSFRFDWRRDYVPVDAGFSPNKHGKGTFSMVGFPLVEMLAAIGISHARPKRLDKLRYRYGVIGGGSPLDPVFLRAALGGETSPVPGASFRTFLMQLDYPGQEDQARCITEAKEVTPSEQ